MRSAILAGPSEPPHRCAVCGAPLPADSSAAAVWLVISDRTGTRYTSPDACGLACLRALPAFPHRTARAPRTGTGPRPITGPQLTTV
jgi:hypothetical protein